MSSKIPKKYDLLDKISESKGEISLTRDLRYDLKAGAYWAGLYSLLNMLQGKDLNRLPLELLFGTPILITLLTLFKSSDQLINRETNTRKALEALQKLTIQLKEYLEIDTNLPLLLKSKQDENSEYELVSGDGMLPGLMQRKYILVPSFELGRLKDTSILQEHILGSNTFFLSKGIKSKELKLVTRMT